MDIPAEALQQQCWACHGPVVVPAHLYPTVDEAQGEWVIGTECAAPCRQPATQTRGHYWWPATYDDYQAAYGHPHPTKILPGDPRLDPIPVADRVLPPGPWGYLGYQPIPLPDEAWDVHCTHEFGQGGRGVPRPRCGVAMVPNVEGFYYDEFTSTARIAHNCPSCGTMTMTFSWTLPAEVHRELFGRDPGDLSPDYRPAVEPIEYDEGYEPAGFEYSMWQNADPAGTVTHFENLAELIEQEDYDLRTIAAGTFTVRHWGTEGQWDMPAFVADHAELIAAEYAEMDADYAVSGDYDEDTGEWIGEGPDPDAEQ